MQADIDGKKYRFFVATAALADAYMIELAKAAEAYGKASADNLRESQEATKRSEAATLRSEEATLRQEKREKWNMLFFGVMALGAVAEWVVAFHK